MAIKRLEAVDYFQWLAKNKEVKDEQGMCVLITDAAVREGEKWGQFIVMHGMMEMSHALYCFGKKPVESIIGVERDSTLRAEELYLTFGSEFEGTTDQYLVLAYHMWKREQDECRRLECLSLWGHIKQWFRWRIGDEA